mmetsp:Transcript_25350/g.45909  ORF Transcript_25350/g.45909 Transcript_25350/m.45909 type:complete len:214 (+) Transcript_25350:43-684(+)
MSTGDAKTPGSGEGLRVQEFFHTCLKDNRGPFLVSLILGGIALLTTLILTWQHVSRLRQRPICMLQSYYTSIFVFPTVWAISAFSTLICPRSAPLAELAQGQSEAWAIYVFLVILFVLVARESLADEVRHASEEQHLETKARGTGAAIVTALARQGPQPFFAVPPFFLLLCQMLPQTRPLSKAFAEGICISEAVCVPPALLQRFQPMGRVHSS